MRDRMKNGQLAFFYHSNCKNPGIAGIVEVIKMLDTNFINCYFFYIHVETDCVIKLGKRISFFNHTLETKSIPEWHCIIK